MTDCFSMSLLVRIIVRPNVRLFGAIDETRGDGALRDLYGVLFFGAHGR
jgi:hypothetical protein